MKTALRTLTLSLLVSTALCTDNVMEKAKELGHTTFYKEVEESGLLKHATKQPDEDGSMAPFTVFVPDNAAWEALKNTDQESVKSLIKFHVVPGQAFKTKDELPTDGAPTVGEQLVIANGDTLYIEESKLKATIIDGPYETKNGVVYVINKVLTPANFEKPETSTTEKDVEPKTQTLKVGFTEIVPANASAAQPTTPASQQSPSPEHQQSTQIGATSWRQTISTQTTEAIQQLTHAIRQLTQTLQQQYPSSYWPTAGQQPTSYQQTLFQQAQSYQQPQTQTTGRPVQYIPVQQPVVLIPQ